MNKKISQSIILVTVLQASELVNRGAVVKREEMATAYRTVHAYRDTAETLPEATGSPPPWVSNHGKTI